VSVRDLTLHLAAICDIALGLLVFLKDRKSPRNIAFSLFTLSTAIWTLQVNYFLIAKTYQAASFWIHSIAVQILFICVTYYHFILTIEKRPISNYYARLIGSYSLIIFGAIGYAIPDFYIKDIIFHSWGKQNILGIGFHLVYFIYAGYISLAFFRLINIYRDSVGTHRNQIKYLIGGTLLPIVIGSYFNWFLVLFGNYKYIWAGPYASFLLVVIIFYAIVRYRLMEINLAFRNATIHFLYSCTIAIPAILMVVSTGSLIITAFSIFFAVAVTPWLFPIMSKWLTVTVDRLPPFRGRYERFRDIESHARNITYAQSVDEWSWQLVRTVSQLFEPKTVSVLIYDESLKAFHIKAGINLNPAQMVFMELPLDSPLVKHFITEKCLLIKDLISHSYSLQEANDIRVDMDFICSEVCIPIFLGGELKAILNIDEKSGNSMYNDLDLATIGTLARSAEQALHAILAGMGIVQITSVWAHDLLKPFGPKGSFRFAKEILEGTFGPISDELKTAVQLMFLDTHFVAKYLGKVIKPSTVGDLFDIKPRPLTGIYMRIREKYSISAIESGIKWIVKPPPEDLEIMCDMEMIEYRVITNLVENAFRFTPRDGFIELAYKLESGSFIGYVKDSGIGIRKEDLSKVFERGTQLDETNKGVAGLGLYSVSTVVNAHKGRVWVESEFSKGSTFYFQLPRKN